MKDYIVSVVIPTYNRYEYLIPAIQSMIRISNPNLEIVIQDNSTDNREIVNFLNSIQDDRVKYYYKETHISMSENCELGVTNSTGLYVCLMGDDDTICESLIDAAFYCKEHDVDACMYPFPGFNWPDMTFEGVKEEANLFYMFPADGTIAEIDSQAILNHAIKSAEGLPRIMPRAYHGLVSRDCLERAKEVCGSYFPGPSPDIANSVAVCLTARKAVYISDYLIVSGYGYNSARGQGNRKQHYGKISEKPWLPNNTEEVWEKDIPKIFSAETIFAESMVKALKAMKRKDLADQYCYSALYALFLRHHKDAGWQMLKFCLKKPKRFIMTASGIFTRLKYRRELLQTKTAPFKEVSNITSLKEAQEYTSVIRKECVRNYTETDTVISYGW